MNLRGSMLVLSIPRGVIELCNGDEEPIGSNNSVHPHSNLSGSDIVITNARHSAHEIGPLWGLWIPTGFRWPVLRNASLDPSRLLSDRDSVRGFTSFRGIASVNTVRESHAPKTHPRLFAESVSSNAPHVHGSVSLLPS